PASAASLARLNRASAYWLRSVRVASSVVLSGEYSSEAINSSVPVRGAAGLQPALAEAYFRLSSSYLACSFAASAAAWSAGTKQNATSKLLIADAVRAGSFTIEIPEVGSSGIRHSTALV